MHVSELAEETEDLDWFALDEEGAVGHFATGGCGALPRSIAISLEDLKTVADYFKKLSTPVTSPVVSPTLDSYVSLSDDVEKVRYLRDFVKMASRGLFSFDYIHTGIRPSGYFLVAKPSVALEATALPQGIRQILERTVLVGVCFRTSTAIGVGTLQ